VFLSRSTLRLTLALGKKRAVALEVPLLVAIPALRSEEGRTDNFAIGTRAVLDKVAGVALLVLAGVKADLAEGLPRLARLMGASSTTTPC